MKRNWTKRLIVIVLIAVLTATMISFSGSTFAFAEVGGYYSSITATSGLRLLGQLHDLITTTHKKYTSYDDCSNPNYVVKTDPGSESGYVMEFYSQADISKSWGSGKPGTWNREHVWCQSLSNGLWGKTGGGADMHHIRPSESTLNSTRGNSKFGDVNKQNPKYYKDKNGNNVAIGGYLAADTFEPLDEVKGDVARIVMYVYTHYNTYSNVGGTTNGSGGTTFGTLKFTNVVNARTEEAAIKLLLEWNEMDPVDDNERTRNEAVYQIQGNRNPFIDNPNYAKAIWGGEDIPIVKLTGMTMDSKTLEITEGQTKRLTLVPTPYDADATSNWESSNENVATVSSAGLVTGVAEGTAVITATSVNNSSITATATVTVKAKSTTDPDENCYITITQQSFDMTAGYNFKNWTAGEIGGIAYIYGGSNEYPIGENNGMQFNISRDSYYIASYVATPQPIKSVTVTMVEKKADRHWKLLTSNVAYGEVAKKPTNGNDHGTKLVTAESVTWDLNGCTDTYFALTCEEEGTSAASYIQSIIVEYGASSGGDDVVVSGLDVRPGNLVLDEENATIDAIRKAITVEVLYSDNSKKVTSTYEISGFDASKEIQTVTVSSEGKSATISVTIQKKQVPPILSNADEFISAVDNIAEQTNNESKYKAILIAINEYKELSQKDKENETVVEKYQTLQMAISEYNQEIESINSASKNATENAIILCLSLFSALGAVIYLLKKNLF